MNVSTKGKKTPLIRFFIWIVLSLMIIPQVFVFPVSATSSTYYVSTTGSNSNPGTFDHPWKTIQYGINHISGGDTLYVMNGDYNENIRIYTNRSGTSSQWTTITSYTHWGATINGNGKTITYPSEGLVLLLNVSYLRFTGFQIKNSTVKGIHAYGWLTNHVRFDNLSIYNTSSGAIAIQAMYNGDDFTKMPHNCTVENNTCINICNAYGTTPPASGEGMELERCRDCVSQYNTIKLCSKECMSALESRNCTIRYNKINTTHKNYFGACEVGILLDGWYKGVDGTQIYNNWIWGNGTGVLIEGEHGGGDTHISVFNNIIHLNATGSTTIGIFLGYDVPHTDINISSNTIYATTTTGCAFSAGTISKNYMLRVNISNNIFYTPLGYYAAIFEGINTTDKCVTLSNNLYNSYGWDGTTRTKWRDGDKKAFPFDAHYVNANPQFKNANTGDFHLNATSPCIDAGTSNFAPSFDYDGNSRPQGDGYDIGAYEYVTGVGDTTSPTISNIATRSSTPLDTQIGWENITCTVTDNIAVYEVILYLTDSGHTTTNIPMRHKSGTSIYYYNTTLTQTGNYSYYLWADDTSNNHVASTVMGLSIPPNWDINRDGRCTILDQVLISVHYSEIGSAGWIREDVDNNGVINVLDLSLTSNHYGESWWV